MTYTWGTQMVEFKHALNQGDMEMLKLPEAASQSATKAGDLIYLVSGAVTLCDTTDPATVYGVMMEDCTGTTGNEVLVNRIRPGDVYEMSCVSGHTPGTDIYRGCKYGVDQTGAGNWEVDATTSAGYPVVVLDYVEETPTSGGRVLVIFSVTCIQSEIGA